VYPVPPGERYQSRGPEGNPVVVERAVTFAPEYCDDGTGITVQYRPIVPAAAEAGGVPHPGAHHPSSVPVGIGSEPPYLPRQAAGGGFEAPCNLRQVCPPSAVHTSPSQRVDVPAGSVLVPQTVVQGDPVVGQWVRAPIDGAGVPCSSSVPAAKQEGFIAEAWGMGPTINTDQIPPLYGRYLKSVICATSTNRWCCR